MNSATERRKNVMSGALVVKGTRVPVARIIYLVSQGRSFQNIIKTNYPFLTVDQIRNALEDAGKEIEFSK